jgi:hypothetical protein
MLFMMPRLATQSTSRSNIILRGQQLRHFALLALATSISSPPLATSFSALATTPFSRQSSVFGLAQNHHHHHQTFLVAVTSSLSNRSKKTSLFSTTSDVSGEATSTTSMSSTSDETTKNEMTPSSKLEALRSKMKELDLDVYIVPSDDPHLSGE